MAKILFSGGVGAASGSIGGNVFSRNANGAYIRNKGIPTNPNTIAQQNARAALAAQSVIWRSLTDAQKQTFRDQVTAYPYIDVLGQSKTYTPSQLCGAVNGRVKQANRYITTVGDGLPAPVITTMVAPFGFPFPEDASMAYSVASPDEFIMVVGLSDAAASLPDGTILLVDATAPLSQGKTSPKNSDFRNLFVLGSNKAVDDTIATSAYSDVFGVSINLDDLIYFRFTTLNTDIGQYSNSINTVLQITA